PDLFNLFHHIRHVLRLLCLYLIIIFPWHNTMQVQKKQAAAGKIWYDREACRLSVSGRFIRAKNRGG
ncbi:MAG: hypothetical protein J6U01_04055, partial [Clostridia bacterium]|nr:hypothetical protein [Clostridia bacterium]